MKIRPSSALRNDYTAISELAKVSGEPIFITNKGEDDGVFMSMAAFEEREKMYRHRDKIYEAEMSRLRGDPAYTSRQTILRLRDFPLMGQIHPDPLLAAENYRKLVLTNTYVAVYRVSGDTVYIYRVVNGTTDYPRLLK